MTDWKPITDEIKRKVLVTNNLKGRDAFGQMSHIWCVIVVTKENDGEFVAISDGDRLIHGLTHYAEIPA